MLKMAPVTGFEPVTKWLTATYSTAELHRNKNTFNAFKKVGQIYYKRRSMSTPIFNIFCICLS